MDDSYYPAYFMYDGWVLKYLSVQREMAAFVFNEVPWRPVNYPTVAPLLKHNNSNGARYSNVDLSNTVHAAKTNRVIASEQNDYYLIDHDVSWCL